MAEQETVADVLADIRTKKVIGYPNAWLPRLEAAHTRELEALRVLLKQATVDQWHPDFVAKKYNSDEPEENVFRDAVLDAIAARETTT